MTSVLYTHLRKEEITISLIPTLKFVAVGVLWIIISDLALFLSQSAPMDHFPLFHMEIFKGILFVFAMGIFFFILHQRINRQRNEIASLDLFRKNPQPMFIYSLESLKFLDVNDAAASIYGYSRNEFLEMTICQIRPPEDIGVLHKAVQQLQNGYRFIGQSRHLHKNGNLIHCEISAYSIAFNGQHAGLIMAIDISNRMKVEDALVEAKASHEKAVNDRLYEVALLNKELQIRIREINSNNDELIEVNKLLQHASRSAMARYEARLQRNQEVMSGWMTHVSKPLWSIDLKDVNETYVSEGALALFGCTRSVVVDQPNFWQRSVHNRDKRRINDELLCLEDNDLLKFEYLHADGTRNISQEIKLIRDEDGKVVKITSWAEVI